MRFGVLLCLLAAPTFCVPKIKHLSKNKHVLILDDASDCPCDDPKPRPAGGASCNCPTAEDAPETAPEPSTAAILMSGSSGLAVTDLNLLTVYRGHDASDRSGIAEFGDLIHDFRAGWNVWPANVPFMIDDSVGNCVRSTVALAVEVINDNSCVGLYEEKPTAYINKNQNNPYEILHITSSGEGCFASLGFRSQSENIVNIGDGCVNVGTVLHLILHALGMHHENQRPDRDAFVKVNGGVVDISRVGGFVGTTKFEALFSKANDTSLRSPWVKAVMAREYDYGSIMHNGPCHYSNSEYLGGAANGCTIESTLIAKAPVEGPAYLGHPSQIGNRGTLSMGDVKTLNALYMCSNVWGREAPLAADAMDPEVTLCTIEDATMFAWDDRVIEARAAAAANGTMSDGATSSAVTQNPIEKKAFSDFFRDEARSRLFFIILGVVTFILIMAFLGVYHYFKRKRKGTAAAVEGAPAPDGTAAPLLNTMGPEKETGESTDSEIYEEIMNEDIEVVRSSLVNQV